MEISQHIKNLLLTNERVILGGFGAFDSKHIPASIDKETKTMTPPHKIIVFNPEYTQDEGLLAKHMAEKENISFDNANEQISEYVKTIKTKLDAGETVNFKDLGELKKAADGSLDFAYHSEDNLLVDSFGLPKVSLSEQEQTKTISQKNLRKESLKQKESVKRREPIKIKPSKQIIQKEKPKQKEKIAPVKKTPPVKRQKPAKLKKEKTKKKKLFLPVLLIVIGVIAILLVAVYFFKPDLWEKGYTYSSEKIAYVKKSIFGSGKDNLEIITPDDENNQTEEVADNQIETDEQSSDATNDTVSTEEIVDNQTENVSDVNTEEVQDNNTQEVSVNTNTGSAQSGKYYIIIGSVKSKMSAQKEQQRFVKKGITTNIIYVPHMERFRISIGEFSSAKAAQDFFANFQNKHGSIDAWVWEKR